MKHQDELLNQFKKRLVDYTYKQISSQTGIQMTRVFRIFNGYEMKVSEYFALKEMLEEKNEAKDFDHIIEKCRMQLSDSSLKEIEMVCKKKLNLLELIISTENIVA
ncbi:hypothetical protein [Bacteriovorax sp. DB6_IX]|uniref:hypothetical protein n=1 Tax=Bacteriovorax sp. DB6_IX TaxID=1353530 RepID=UPI00038A1349|nr:hypothetical protein [Bacteriovorax sp. DB6_IX]EQC49629.1 hypothetical protein M901_2651 [Bacteriovorax sp. DB6_IX]